MVELVQGYGVRLSRRQLDEALDNSSGSSTKLIRNLMSVFFSKDVVAASSALGGRKNQALHQDIIGACLRKSIYDMFNTVKDSSIVVSLICRICVVKARCSKVCTHRQYK